LINFSFHYRIKITKIKLSEKNKKELRKLGIEIVYLFGSYAKKMAFEMERQKLFR